MGVWVPSFRNLFVCGGARREVVSVVCFGFGLLFVWVFQNLSKFYCLPQKLTVQCYGALFGLEFKFSGGLWCGFFGENSLVCNSCSVKI